MLESPPQSHLKENSPPVALKPKQCVCVVMPLEELSDISQVFTHPVIVSGSLPVL